MISSGVIVNTCKNCLKNEARRYFLWEAGKRFPKEVTLELGLEVSVFRRNLKQKELTDKYI